jgi:hypothetical protein
VVLIKVACFNSLADFTIVRIAISIVVFYYLRWHLTSSKSLMLAFPVSNDWIVRTVRRSVEYGG